MRKHFITIFMSFIVLSCFSEGKRPAWMNVIDKRIEKNGGEYAVIGREWYINNVSKHTSAKARHWWWWTFKEFELPPETMNLTFKKGQYYLVKKSYENGYLTYGYNPFTQIWFYELQTTNTDEDKRIGYEFIRKERKDIIAEIAEFTKCVQK